MKRILDPSFRYRPSYATDIRKTIAAARRRKEPVPKPDGTVLYVVPRKSTKCP